MTMPGTFNRRHSPNRRKTNVDATLSVDGREVPVVIRDISYEGMRVEVGGAYDIGTPATIMVLDHQIPAIIHWYDGGFAGLHLLARLDSQLLIALETAADDLADFR